ncbi:MAG: CPP1-like family protein [Geitlerinemataceae cyanobacterium]
MSDRNPYERLGVSEDSSFEEIQQARQRQIERSSEDGTPVEQIEMAYDAVLMDRLRMRQQGKIKVPEGIRFPERKAPAPAPASSPSLDERTPGWIRDSIDRPERNDILIPAGVFLALSVLSAFGAQYAPIALAFGAGASLYLLNRKDGRFGRAALLTLVSVTFGIIIGSLLAPLLGTPLAPEIVASWLAFFVLWLTTSFLR